MLEEASPLPFEVGQSEALSEAEKRGSQYTGQNVNRVRGPPRDQVLLLLHLLPFRGCGEVCPWGKQVMMMVQDEPQPLVTVILSSM